MDKVNDNLIFFTAEGPDEGHWRDTILLASAAGNSPDKKAESTLDLDDAAGISRSLARHLVEFSFEFGLEGNVWVSWIAFNIMMNENPFSAACERNQAQAGSSAAALALHDISILMKMIHMDPGSFGSDILGPFTNYIPVTRSGHANTIGRRITDFGNSLLIAHSGEEFLAVILDHYRLYGVGSYGLYRAFRVTDDGGARLVPVTEGHDVCMDDLVGYEEQKRKLRENTEAFIQGRAANNVLLYGDSGTGKSTSIHALMHDYYDQGLRLVEVGKQCRHLLPSVLSLIKKRNYRFIIFLDDLSFEENESDYKELKAMLEGALETRSDRAVIYATSNRRHLIRETWRDRNDMEYQEDIHHSDTMEEKLSLASRFGVTIYYSKPVPAEYLNIVRELADREGIDMPAEELDAEARKWELRHGGMTGRTASQFIAWLKGRM